MELLKRLWIYVVEQCWFVEQIEPQCLSLHWTSTQRKTLQTYVESKPKKGSGGLSWGKRTWEEKLWALAIIGRKNSAYRTDKAIKTRKIF